MKDPRTATGARRSGVPWYRQFWPWFLIALPGTVVVAALWTLVIANRYADDLVVDEYYKEGLAINLQLERQEAARQRELAAVLRRDGRQLMVELSGRITTQPLRLTLSHPMDASRDLVLPLEPAANQRYVVTLPLALTGRWHWIIDAGTGSEWRLDGTVTL